MRTIAFAALLLAFVAAPEALGERDSRFSDSLERAFAPGGKVNLNLSAGDCELMRGADNRIRVVWSTRTDEQLADAKVRVNVRHDEATVRTSGPGNGFRVQIELPRRTDLYLRMTAGDLTISGIEGNKDVALRAGDLVIDVDDPAKYGQVNASLWAGDISARPFGFSTGGLFRSFSHRGKGPFELRARLWAGDLRLRQQKSDQ